MKLRKPSKILRASSSLSVRSPFSWPASLRLPPRSRQLPPAVPRVVEAREAVVETLAVGAHVAVVVVVAPTAVVVAYVANPSAIHVTYANVFCKRQANAGEDTNVPGQVLPLTETSNQATDTAGEATTNGEAKPRGTRQPRQRGPPEDGIPSKNKVMVANLPYDLSEEKVRFVQLPICHRIHS